MNPLYSSKPIKRNTPKPMPSSSSSSSSALLQASTSSTDGLSSNDIKRDLLALGIDLDESLIERMHRNLGISSTFQSVSKTSAIVQERKKAAIEINNANNNNNVNEDEIAFRHVQSPTEPLASPNKVANLPQFQSSPQKAFTILRGFESRHGMLEPHIRSTITKVINSFRISYSRNPDLFIRRLLNLRKKTNLGQGKGMVTASTQAVGDPHSYILQHRYMDESTFVSAMQRMSSDISIQAATELFNQLMEQKTFGHHHKRNVVDLCLFVSLFRSEDLGRRSFDFSDSLVAHDVAFWNQKRAAFPNGLTNAPNTPAGANGRVSSAGVLRDACYLETTRNPSRSRHFRSKPDNKDPTSAEESGDQDNKGDNHDASTVATNAKTSCTDDSVSELLGRSLPQHPSGHNQGRYVIGVIRIESKKDQTKVSVALNSPQRERSLLQTKRRVDTSLSVASPDNNIAPQPSNRRRCGSAPARRSHNIIHWLEEKVGDV